MTHVDLRASFAQGQDEQTKVRDGPIVGVVNPADILMKIFADPVRHLWRVCDGIDQITKHELWRCILGPRTPRTKRTSCDNMGGKCMLTESGRCLLVSGWAQKRWVHTRIEHRCPFNWPNKNSAVSRSFKRQEVEHVA